MSRKYYGYRFVNGMAIVHEQESAVVRKLYESYIETSSISASAKAAGLTITHSSVSRLLMDRIFLGTDYYPRIIDEETFNKVQELRKEAINKRRRKNPEPATIRETIFIVGQVDEKYDDPYRQAEYAYGLIEEEINE